jgi:hypothetical protein
MSAHGQRQATAAPKRDPLEYPREFFPREPRAFVEVEGRAIGALDPPSPLTQRAAGDAVELLRGPVARTNKNLPTGDRCSMATRP